MNLHISIREQELETKAVETLVDSVLKENLNQSQYVRHNNSVDYDSGIKRLILEDSITMQCQNIES